MSQAPWRVTRLDAGHERAAFDCGVPALDRYLREQVNQDVRRRITACFVALAEESRVIAYYTLASASLLLADLPAGQSRRLPRYPTVPAVRLGRLAVDRSCAGQGLGGALLADALLRAARSEIAAYALLVDAKDECAAAFYRHHSFLSLPDTPQVLFLPLATVRGCGVTRRAIQGA